jgi:hypothetical protein
MICRKVHFEDINGCTEGSCKFAGSCVGSAVLVLSETRIVFFFFTFSYALVLTALNVSILLVNIVKYTFVTGFKTKEACL